MEEQQQPAHSYAIWHWLIICLLLLAAGQGLSSLTSVDISEPRSSLNGHIEKLSSTSEATLAEVRALPETRWQSAADDINLGYTTEPHWFRFSLDNPGERQVQRLLELGYPLLDEVELYLIGPGNELKRHFATGDNLPFDSRPIAHRNFVFPIGIEPETEIQGYLRIRTDGAFQAPLTLWDGDTFYIQSERSLILESMLYGVLLVMAAFNLLLFGAFRERAYLYYVGVVSSLLVLMTGLDGFGFQYLYPGWPAFHGMVILIFVPLCLAMLCLFASEFLAFERHPHWRRIFRVLIAASVICVLGAFVLSYELSTRLSVYLAVPVAAINLLAGIVLWRQGEQGARLFSVAWLTLLAGVLVAALHKIGLVGSSVITEQGIPLGASALTLMFSFALAERFNQQREAYLKEKQHSLEAMRQQHRAEEALVHAASHHELTGLPNRQIFERVAGQSIVRHPDRVTGIFMLHLKNFDDVNKTLGHRHADELLALFTTRMNRLLMDHAPVVILEGEGARALPVAHVEGVSFAFAGQEKHGDTLLARMDAVSELIGEPLEFMGLSLELSFAVGCCFASPQERDPQTLLRNAFIALGQKASGNGSVAIYEPSMNPYSPRRLTLMTELRDALRTDSLCLHFQPQVHLASSRVAGFEALLRWTHPEHGFIPPDEFIPMAEQTGLIKPITRWVVREALLFCAALDEARCDAAVSVNISAVNLREPGFCEDLCQLLERHRVAAERLILEITETAAMENPTLSLNALRALRRANIRVSIDDFGTGHSSLSYIRKLPVSEIKIDRSFVMEMDRNQSDATIVRTTINMCHDLGFKVVAEGVENQAIQDQLQALNCDFVQGYHIARPMGRDDALQWLTDSVWQRRTAPID